MNQLLDTLGEIQAIKDQVMRDVQIATASEEIRQKSELDTADAQTRLKQAEEAVL